jgi:hypothetical protein
MKELIKVDYKTLNARQKENYNFHKVASALAEYGYNSMRLNDDWQGADFIAIKGEEMIKVQLKGRFTIDKKYLGKEIYIAFIEDGVIKIYDHDVVVNSLSGSILETESWNITGNYSWPKTPNTYSDIITVLNV